MTLSNNDLKQIRTVVKEEIGESEKRTDVKFAQFEKRTDVKFAQFEKRTDVKFAQFEKRTDVKFENLEKNTSTKFGSFEKRLSKKIEDEVVGLAVMTKRGFDGVDEQFRRVNQKIEQQDKKLNRAIMGISHLEFIATEMVRRDELLEVKQRLERLEKRAGILK